MRRVIVFITLLLCFSPVLPGQATKQQSAPGGSLQSTKPAASPAPAVASKEDAGAEAARQALRAIEAAQAKRKQAEDLVREWFLRWNALDGKEESLNKFLDLYHPGAMHEVGPNERQAGGAVTYEGHRLIRKMAEDFSKTWTAIAYRIAFRTVREKTAELIQTAEAPWGAAQVAVEFTGGQIHLQSKKRFMLRGAAFFEFENGKITKVRTYVPKDEMLVITGPLSVTM